MNWSGQAIVLSSRPHGEGAAIVQVLAREHGRYAGLVHGRRAKGGLLQPGNLVEARWRARLAEHLGVFTLELKAARTGALEDRLALAGLGAACAIAASALPERDPHPAVFDGLELVLSHLSERSFWPALYVRWEIGLLGELGFGIDRPTLHGAPRFMTVAEVGNGPSWAEILEALKITGAALETTLYAAHNAPLPEARRRLMDELARMESAERAG